MPRRRRYKEYLRDLSLPIPRQTLFNRKKRRTESPDITTENYESDNAICNDSGSVYTSGSGHSSDVDSDVFSEAHLFENSESECSEEEKDNFDTHQGFGFFGGDHKIFEGSSVSQKQMLLLILLFIHKHALTDNAIQDLFDLINIILPNVVPETRYMFFKQFQTSSFIYHYFCEDCTYYFGPDSQGVDNTNCCFCHDSKTIDDAKINGWRMAYWSIEDQLKLLCKDDIVRNALTSNNRQSYETRLIADAGDGHIHRDLKTYGYDSKKDITMLWNIDGVPVFKSSNQSSLWPIQCSILELPPKLRNSHILMPALWCSKDKVLVEVLMKPFVLELEKLSTQGMELNGKHIKVFAPICSSDSIARPKIRNSRQFNGLYGCDWCYHTGEEVAKGRGSTRVYPYRGDVELRTKESIENDARVAAATNNVHRGIISPSILCKLPYFDIANGFVPDFLHSCLLGVSRQFLNLWIDSKHHEQFWYIGKPDTQKKYDKQIANIQVPKEIRRAPRKFSSKEHWKGNEFKAFTLFYSLILLRGILPDKYLNHWFLFVWSLHTLLGTAISAADLETSDAILKEFVLRVATLYGVEENTFNVHQLTHLSKSVQMCGPLHSVSTFSFEGNNAFLKKMVQGTQHVLSQVTNSYTLFRALPLYLNNAKANDGKMKMYVNKLYSGHTETQKGKRFGNNDEIVGLGNPIIRNLSVVETLAINKVHDGNINHKVYIYQRYIVSNKLYDCKNYTRSNKRQNSNILAMQGDNKFYCLLFGLYVVKKCSCHISNHEMCNCPTFPLMLGMKYAIDNQPLYKNVRFKVNSRFKIDEVKTTGLVVALQAVQIISKCVKIVKDNSSYLCVLPNMIEFE